MSMKKKKKKKPEQEERRREILAARRARFYERAARSSILRPRIRRARHGHLLWPGQVFCLVLYLVVRAAPRSAASACRLPCAPHSAACTHAALFYILPHYLALLHTCTYHLAPHTSIYKGGGGGEASSNSYHERHKRHERMVRAASPPPGPRLAAFSTAVSGAAPAASSPRRRCSHRQEEGHERTARPAALHAPVRRALYIFYSISCLSFCHKLLS